MADTTSPHTYVVGAGPGGLAVAAELRRRAVAAVVLERSDAVGSSWRGHYDGLRLHTTRRLSSLPGLAIPRVHGRWVARDDVVHYLESYARHHGVVVRTGVQVKRVEQSDGGAWNLLADGDRLLCAPTVVVATGHNHTPDMPDWPGMDGFHGELLHASHYRNAAPYAGRDVLVVGVGNTGAEIAAELAGTGAARVRLAVRTPPHIVRRTTAGWPAQATGILVRRLPPRLVDRAAPHVARLSVPDLSPYGLPRPPGGLYSRVLDGSLPVQDVGLIDAVRAGRVEVVAAVAGFDGDEVLLADGSRIRPGVVVAATGYRRELEPLVGHLGVLDGRGRPAVSGGRSPDGAPGLYFTGFTNPISGMLRELAIDARRIARAVAVSRSSRGPGWRVLLDRAT